MPNKSKKTTPIKWHPLCEETLQYAQNKNKAIFITIGYNSCKLCQDMEDKVINNEKCKKILEESFVCIKIDKDQRADIDKYYQRVHKIINNRTGGWPLSIFATPQNKPFFASTYIQLESEEGSIEGMGFLELISLISHKVKQNDETLYKNADDVYKFLNKDEHPSQATVLKEEFYKTFLLQAKNNYDTKNGGFSSKPKFPHANTLKTLLFIDNLYENDSAKDMVLHTLKEMAKGGFYDKENYGFYRYCMSEDWSMAGDEKTLYDNALLGDVYLQAYKLYKDETFLDIAKNCTTVKEIKPQLAHSSMMASTMLKLSKVDKTYKQKAIQNLNDLNFTKKEFLDGYAFFIEALLNGYDITKDETYLVKAQKLTNEALCEFYKKGAWYFSNNEFSTQAQVDDTTHTSALSTMIGNLLSISFLLEDEKYAHFAFKTLEYNSYELGRKTIYYPSMLLQMIRYLKKLYSF